MTSYANTNLQRNVTYHYRVCAYNVAGDSAYSNTGSAKTAAAGFAGASETVSSPNSAVAWSSRRIEAEGWAPLDQDEFAIAELVSL